MFENVKWQENGKLKLLIIVGATGNYSPCRGNYKVPQIL